ncbi:DUF1702 family protein [Ktedonospora formicarum]|uniref:Enediyne biosynthesis protein n=1 Tax=Ktedonospora formicarum TaxID=2778364 RepID=A0A8J3MWX9_9CHLR|nr:DUF1702 family protein [Ktedonospora formicarum]GHO48020.1 hypothetical protein KSX_61830 [Ktedonospora formicarum]
MTNSLFRTLRRTILRSVPKAQGSDQKVMAVVMKGFRLTLEDDRFDVLVAQMNEVDANWRGFAYEGIGLGFTVFDYFMPWRTRLQEFVRGPGAPYIIPIYIGAGLAIGRMGGRRIERFMARLDHPAFRWMVVDGYGFYKGFFARQRYLEKQEIPSHLSPYARRVFDQGMGRSIWFATGESVEQVIDVIAAFPESRQADLWSGAAFACAYAGSPMEREALGRLLAAAGSYRPQLALAGALAAKRRYGFGHITPHTELACRVFCERSGETVAHIANEALENLPSGDTAHEIWRERIEQHFLDAVANEAQS